MSSCVCKILFKSEQIRGCCCKMLRGSLFWDTLYVSMCRSVCLSVGHMSRAKTAEPIQMPIRVWTGVGQSNHRYYVKPGAGPPRKGNFWGEGAHPVPLRSISAIFGSSCPLGGSSDAACRCQYCSNLLLLVLILFMQQPWQTYRPISKCAFHGSLCGCSLSLVAGLWKIGRLWMFRIPPLMSKRTIRIRDEGAWSGVGGT